MTRFELPHARTDPDNRTGEIVSQHQRHAIREDELELTVPDLHVEKVDGCRVDLDQDIIVPHFGLRHFGNPADFLFAVAIDDEGFIFF
jgi:hypothetical protein